jgi:amino acid transporter
VALIIAVFDGMIWSELGAAMPGSGGSYRYLKESFARLGMGRLMAFLFIWQFIISGQ